MNLYAFELGRKKELCASELIAVLGKDRLVEKNLDTAIFELDNPDIQALQNRLGGTIKIIEINKQLSAKTDLQPAIQDLLENNFKDHSGKIPFSISLLSFMNPRELDIKPLLNFSKKILKSLGLNSRFVNKNFQNTKPSTIYKARVIEKGLDICIINGEKALYLGASVSIQDIDSYSARDYGKPKRDARAGMLPPKLAQIMINLTGQNTKTIYDPFCGTGSVLMEALLMGKNTIGSDQNPKMTEYSQENCQWTISAFLNPKTTPPAFRIFEKDARRLSKQDLPERVDAVVTEGYLGLPMSHFPTEENRKRTFSEIADLTANWLRAIYNLTPKNCRVVLCVPAYKNRNNIVHLPNFAAIAQQTGYSVSQTFTYDRPDQTVARDIKVLEKI